MKSEIKPTIVGIINAVNYIIDQTTVNSLTSEVVSSLINNIIYCDDDNMTNFNDYVEAALKEWDVKCDRHHLNKITDSIYIINQI